MGHFYEIEPCLTDSHNQISTSIDYLQIDHDWTLPSFPKRVEKKSMHFLPFSITPDGRDFQIVWISKDKVQKWNGFQQIVVVMKVPTYNFTTDNKNNMECVPSTFHFMYVYIILAHNFHFIYIQNVIRYRKSITNVHSNVVRDSHLIFFAKNMWDVFKGEFHECCNTSCLRKLLKYFLCKFKRNIIKI